MLLQEILVADRPDRALLAGSVPPNSDVQIYPSLVPVFVWHPRLQQDFAVHLLEQLQRRMRTVPVEFDSLLHSSVFTV